MLAVLYVSTAQLPVGRPGPAPSVRSSNAMYDWWCKGERATLHLCKQHNIAAELSITTDEAKRSTLLQDLKPEPPMSKDIRAGVQKDYLQMKSAWCSGPGTTMRSPLCMMPGSRFSTFSRSRTAGASSSDSQEPMRWYCSKPSRQSEPLCKRTEFYQKLRTPGLSSTERSDILKQLKSYPPAPYGMTQAIYTDFCKLPDNAEKPLCLRTRSQAGQEKMLKWFCDKPENAEDIWCKRSSVLKKLRTATTDERKELIGQLQKITPSGSSTSIAGSMSKAKKEFCAQPDFSQEQLCKTTAPSASSLSRRFGTKRALSSSHDHTK